MNKASWKHRKFISITHKSFMGEILHSAPIQSFLVILSPLPSMVRTAKIGTCMSKEICSLQTRPAHTYEAGLVPPSLRLLCWSQSLWHAQEDHHYKDLQELRALHKIKACAYVGVGRRYVAHPWILLFPRREQDLKEMVGGRGLG